LLFKFYLTGKIQQDLFSTYKRKTSMLKQLKYTSILALSALAVACSGGDSGAGTAETPDGNKFNLTNSTKGLVGSKTMDGKLIGYNQNYSFYGVWVNNDKTRQQVVCQEEQQLIQDMPFAHAIALLRKILMAFKLMEQ